MPGSPQGAGEEAASPPNAYPYAIVDGMVITDPTYWYDPDADLSLPVRGARIRMARRVVQDRWGAYHVEDRVRTAWDRMGPPPGVPHRRWYNCIMIMGWEHGVGSGVIDYVAGRYADWPGLPSFAFYYRWTQSSFWVSITQHPHFPVTPWVNLAEAPAAGYGPDDCLRLLAHALHEMHTRAEDGRRGLEPA